MDLKKHYRELHQNALRKVQNNGFSFDPELENEQDSRRGLTLLLRPDQAMKNAFRTFIEAVAAVEPGHYFYPASDIHITILPIISCIPALTLEQLDIHKYIDVIEGAMEGIGKIGVRFDGVFASPSCVMVSGYMMDGNLENLRENIRRAFSGVPLQQSLDRRYKLVTAHSTLVRFSQPVKHPDKILSILNTFLDHHFGEAQFSEVEFVFNDWYQRERHVECLKKFKLKE